IYKGICHTDGVDGPPFMVTFGAQRQTRRTHMAVKYALFNDPGDARTTLRELERLDEVSEDLEYRIHSASDPKASFASGATYLRETSALRGAVYGGVLGALGALATVALLIIFVDLPISTAVGFALATLGGAL